MRTKSPRFRGFLAMLSLALFFSCQKEIRYDLNLPEQPPAAEWSIWKTTGVTGQVTDINGMPVEGAEVKFGSSNKKTDVNGYFSFAEVLFNTGEAFVIVSKPGYFTGSRTFFPVQGSNNYVRIKLLDNRLIGSIDAEFGGKLEVRSGIRIELPAQAIVTSTGTIYTGTVNVYAAYIDPTMADINERMPGDLRGVNAIGEQRVLKSLGMMAVELKTKSGEPLNIKNGSKAKLRFAIPTSLSSNAPGSVPLWYFDETKGLWIEEGLATKLGNEYLGEVAHFSFWNVDIPSEFVKLSLKVISLAHSPVAGAKIRLTSSVSGNQAFDFTDNIGQVAGAVPKGETLKLEVFDNCEVVVFTTTIGPFVQDTELGDIVMNNRVTLQTIYGDAADCNGNPIKSGVVQILLDQKKTEFATISNGMFSITFLNCSNSNSAEVILIDNETQQQNQALNLVLNGDSINAGKVQACGIAADSYVSMNFNGKNEYWTSSLNNFVRYALDTVPPHYNPFLYAGDTMDNRFQGMRIWLGKFPQSPFNLPLAVRALGFTRDAYDINNSVSYNQVDTVSIMATVTSFGPVGQFIEGSFEGWYRDSPAGDSILVNCSFRIKRKERWW